MPGEDKKQENAENTDVSADKTVLKKPVQAEFEVTYTSQSSVSNGTIESAAVSQQVPDYKRTYTVYEGSATLEDVLDNILNGTSASENDSENVFDGNFREPIYSKEYDTKDYIDRSDFKGIDLTDLKTFYNQNGNSSKKTYDYLKDYIIKNKDNPEVLQSTVSRLLDDFNEIYDHATPHKKVGENQPEILDKVINTPDGDELSGFICGPIHSFIMDTLNECGIDAALLSGANVDGSNHLTLLYKQSDGKYVFNNYGKNIVINASNIKDAARGV